MPKVLVVGIPSGVSKRLHDAVRLKKCSLLEGWEYNWIVSNRPPFEINQDQVENTLEKYKGDGPHVIAFKPKAETTRKWLSEYLSQFLRFKWLKNEFAMPELDDRIPALVDHLNFVLQNEQWWDENLKPTEVSSPLLLPQSAFRAKQSVRDLCEFANRVDREAYPAFERSMETFVHAHTFKKGDKSRAWIDDKNNVFDWHGERHGEIPFLQYWKMSYRVPDKFHYDVTSSKTPKCEITCRTGKTFKADHINVDVHGFVI